MKFFKKIFFLFVLLVFRYDISPAQQFPCDGKLYFFGDNNGQTYLSYIDGYTTSTPVVQYVALIPGTYDQNALGANPIDHYIYFIDRNNSNLDRIDTNGNITVTCPGLVNAHRATFDNLGHYWAIEDVSGNNYLYEFDITTCTLIAGPFSVPFSAGMADIAFNLFDCSLYMADGSQVIKMDTTGNLIATYPLGYNTSGAFGGIALGSDGNLYGIKNNTAPGELYEFNLTTSSGGLVYSFPGGEAQPCGCDMASFPCQNLQALFITSADCSISDSIHFINQSIGTISSWKWNFGDGQTDTIHLNPSHEYSIPGSYTVTLIIRQNLTCIYTEPDTFSLVVNAFTIPQAAFMATNVCLGTTTTLTDQSTGSPTSWNWNFGDGSPNVNQQNTSHQFSTFGSHAVSLIITTSEGCRDTVLNQVTVYSNPVALFSDSAHGCAPFCVSVFNDSSNAVSGIDASWHWDFPGGTPSFSTDHNPTNICYNVPGAYDVSMTVTNTYGCSDTLLKTNYVNVFPLPTANFSVAPNRASIHDPTFNFINQWSSDVVKWYWEFGDGSLIDTSNAQPVHSYLNTATNNDYYSYKIGLKVKTIHGCIDTSSRSVELIPEFTFFIANTFSPNGDYINDVFYGKGIGIKKYEIMIFDRWGNLIWKCDHQGKNTDWDNINQEGMASACKWDGKANSGADMAQMDVYVWKVKLTDIFDKEHDYIGVVNLVK